MLTMTKGLDLEERITLLETSDKIRSGQFKVIISLGILFWGSISAAVYKKLDSIDEGIARIYTIDTDITLLQYRQSQQDVFNTQIVAAQEKSVRDVDAKFERLYSRINAMLDKGN